MRRAEAEVRLANALDAWLRCCKGSGIVQSTIVSYARIAGDFYNFVLDAGLYYTDPGFTTIQAYRTSMIDRDFAENTIHHHLTVLRMFFTWASSPDLGDARYYDTNPVSTRFLPKASSKAKRRPYDLLLTDTQIMQLWRNNPIKTTHPELWPRNYAIVVMLLTTELRNAELRNLALADLDFENGVLYVEHGKGDKFRAVDFPEIAQLAVRQYLESGIRPESAAPSAPLFGTMAKKKRGAGTADTGKWHAGSDEWLSALVERHVYAITGVQNIRTHDLRHVGARVDLNAGMPIEELQSKLGHSSVVTTQIYSGRVMPRMSRKSAEKVCAERDLQAQRLLEQLGAAV